MRVLISALLAGCLYAYISKQRSMRDAVIPYATTTVGHSAFIHPSSCRYYYTGCTLCVCVCVCVCARARVSIRAAVAAAAVFVDRDRDCARPFPCAWCEMLKARIAAAREREREKERDSKTMSSRMGRAATLEKAFLSLS